MAGVTSILGLNLLNSAIAEPAAIHAKAAAPAVRQSASGMTRIDHKRRECGPTYHRLPGLCLRVANNCEREGRDRGSCLGLRAYCNQCNDYYVDCISKVGHNADYDCELCSDALKSCQSEFLKDE